MPYALPRSRELQDAYIGAEPRLNSPSCQDYSANSARTLRVLIGDLLNEEAAVPVRRTRTCPVPSGVTKRRLWAQWTDEVVAQGKEQTREVAGSNPASPTAKMHITASRSKREATRSARGVREAAGDGPGVVQSNPEGSRQQ